MKNLATILTAGTLTAFLPARRLWPFTRRGAMGGVLATLATRLAMAERR